MVPELIEALKGKGNNKSEQTANKETENEEYDNYKWYFYDVNKEKRGPLSIEQLLDLKKKELIKPSSVCWNGKSIKQWTPINRVPVLIDILKGNI